MTLVRLAVLLLMSEPSLAPGAKRFAAAGEPSYEIVSLVRLIASPEAYEGKAVRLAGFCSLAFESEAIYLHEDDHRHRLAPNSLRLEPESAKSNRKRVDRRYCIVEGTFRANKTGQLSVRSGRLVDVATIEAIPSYEGH